jgi:hypothetical protein
MKEVFDIHRFGKLLRYDFRVNRWEYLLLLPLSIVALWLVLFMAFGNITASKFQASTYIPIYFMGYLIMGIFLNSRSFGALKNRLSAASYLTLPASAFEKYFLHWLLRIALFSLLYPLVFYIGVNSFIPIFQMGGKIYLDYIGSTASVAEISLFEFNMVKPDTGRFIFIPFAIYFGLIFALSLVQLGSIAFGKWNLVKTILVLISFQALVYLYARLIVTFKGGFEEIRPTFFIDGIPDHITMLEIGLMVLMVVSLLVCWTATFMKLKEREV